MKRYVLLNAHTPDALYGFQLEGRDRSSQEALRRAAAKLESEGLVELATKRAYVRARDPRRERLFFEDGRFWRYADPSRAQRVNQTVVWLSPFGFQIVLRYRAQLEAGMAVRWDAQTVNEATTEAKGDRVRREHRLIAIQEQEERERNAVMRAVRDLIAVLPDEVSTPESHTRWELAVAVSRHRAPNVAPEELWDAARNLWAAGPAETLRAEAERLGLRPASQPTRADLFRSQSRSSLGTRRALPDG